ncbi:organic solute transporter Ostalpha-domain-containing protein [Boeremia exigua]|uniref:organic solute transporter Ostalpha-domain-containing protein n=1 Tax=Boeremia exigua TaxID=749465 RepID=UPI001E8D6E08|nr:organic solute transporter Ostalpha-domain-containing protein [Boeremia exigua]KAH6619963.1 organic solute transporter Ostalpha-domain-containing protein [Boeremia exigua]
MARCNNPLDVGVHEVSLTGGLTSHGLLILLATITSMVACTVSLYLIYQHFVNYSQPLVQKLIIRILFMVPIYSICCTLSVAFYKQNVYLGAIYEFYESLVIASFFLLLCRYLDPDLDKVRNKFAILTPQPWLQPVRFTRKFVFRKKNESTTDGSLWFSVIWICVLQFCVVKFLGALTKVITEAEGVYCKDKYDASYARVWVFVIEILSLVIAMFCLLQFYKQTELELSHHQPLLKFIAIKLVVFLFYVQGFVFNQLTKDGAAMSPTDQISYPSLAVGIPNTVLCFEMAAVAVLHLYAYPYSPFEANKLGVDDNIGMNWKQKVRHIADFTDIWVAIVQAPKALQEHKLREQRQQSQDVGLHLV